jgi:hypothetical protein
MPQTKHYRKKPVAIKGELEETDTEFLLHIRVVSSVKAHQGLRFTLVSPKEGADDIVNARDTVYDFLLSIFDLETADKIIQSKPAGFWRQYINPDGTIKTQTVRGVYEKDVQDQSMETPTESSEPASGFTQGRIPRAPVLE